MKELTGFCIALWLVNCGRVYCQPNILVVIADDMGWGDIGYHGSDIQTPVMDQLSADGVRLGRFYTGRACSPSRAMFYTGRHSIHTRLATPTINGVPEGMRLDVPTLADELGSLGYATHLVGKWHVGTYSPDYLPTRRGFHSFYGFLNGQADYYTHTYGTVMEGHSLIGLDLWHNETAVYGNTDYSTRIYSNHAQALVEAHPRDQPLFMVLSMQAPHIPLQEPPADCGALDYSNISDTDRRTYARMVTCMDEEIGNVVEAFKIQGLWENTLMIFFSDNGASGQDGSSNFPLRGSKLMLWEGGVRVPAFVSGGYLLPATSSLDEYIHVTDLYPTLLHLAGATNLDPSLYGYNVWETLSAGSPSPRQEILLDIDADLKPWYLQQYEYFELEYLDYFPKCAIIRGSWKLVTGPLDDIIVLSEHSYVVPDGGAFKSELFDILADPLETTDVSGQHPEVVASLLARLVELSATIVPPALSCRDPGCDPSNFNGTWSPWLPAGAEPEEDIRYACVPDEVESGTQLFIVGSIIIITLLLFLIGLHICCNWKKTEKQTKSRAGYLRL